MSQAQILPADHFSPSVSIHNGRPATTSLEVAKFFGKRHDNVMRSINDLRANTPEEFTALNFEVSEYTDETGRVLPMFILHRDGFILLVMGYTGKKAMQIKVAYILAFNKMEAQIAGNALPPSKPTALTPSTADDRKPLRSLVHAWAQIAGTSHTALWPQVKAHFQLARIDDLPVEWIGDALAFVQGKIDATGKALPQSNSEMAAASSLANYNQQIANTKPVHIFQRMGLTPLEELQMGSPIKRMFDGLDMDKIGPRTMEALVLKAKYVNAISEVYRLNRHLLKDMDRLMHDINGPAMKALNKSGCFSDPVADTLHEPRERLDRINEEYRAAARAALDGSICMAMMVGV